MTKIKNTGDKTTKRIRLVARIWSVPVTAYALMMAIGYTSNWIRTGTADPYAVEDYPFIENLPPIFMFFAVLGLAIAWRWEKIGAIINLLFCLVIFPILLVQWPITQDIRFVVPYVMLFVVAVPGILFLVFWRRTREIKVN